MRFGVLCTPMGTVLHESSVYRWLGPVCVAHRCELELLLSRSRDCSGPVCVAHRWERVQRVFFLWHRLGSACVMRRWKLVKVMHFVHEGLVRCFMHR